MFIDSMVSHIWLPTSVCESFEKAFNLTWQADAQIYVIDDTTHDQLSKQNPTFKFTLANGSDESSQTVDITLPYAAFDLIKRFEGSFVLFAAA